MMLQYATYTESKPSLIEPVYQVLIFLDELNPMSGIMKFSAETEVQ